MRPSKQLRRRAQAKGLEGQVLDISKSLTEVWKFASGNINSMFTAQARMHQALEAQERALETLIDHNNRTSLHWKDRRDEGHWD